MMHAFPRHRGMTTCNLQPILLVGANTSKPERHHLTQSHSIDTGAERCLWFECRGMPMVQLIYLPRSVVTESVLATVCMNNHNSV